MERVAMRNALGLMLASVLAAVVIAGGWYFYSSRADQGAPKTTAARAADPLPAKLEVVEMIETIAAKPSARLVSRILLVRDLVFSEVVI